MPFNKSQGQSVIFIAVFKDTTDVVTVPSSATLTVTYPPSSNSLTIVSCAIGMTAIGQEFTATWGSSVAALGLSSFAATAPGQVANATGLSGTLRLTSP